MGNVLGKLVEGVADLYGVAIGVVDPVVPVAEVSGGRVQF